MKLAARQLVGASVSRRRPPLRASVLILVVVLLTLLALIGTAFIVTTRTDRVATIQHGRNVRGDLAVESAINTVISEVVGELFGSSGGAGMPEAHFRRPHENLLNSADTFVGRWLLASRLPIVPDPSAPVTPLGATTPNLPLLPNPGGVNPPLWLFTSDPRPGDTLGNPGWPDGSEHVAPDTRTWMSPTARPFLGRPDWPFLQPYSYSYRTGEYSWGAHPVRMPLDTIYTTPEIDPFPAADADGDGIADSVLINSLTPAPVDGLVYYYAVRVIDNNSAVNVNTALARQSDFDGRGARSNDPLYLRSRVGLAEMLRTYNPLADRIQALGDEAGRLSAWRLNDRGLRVAGVDGAGGAGSEEYSHPIGDLNDPRDDFVFATIGDALDRQLASRIGNPGRSRPGRQFRPLTSSDQISLAHRFCLAHDGVSRSQVEELLYDSLLRSAGPSGVKAVPSRPYRADETAAWFERFNYDAEDPSRPETFRDRRALLVARNPLSNLSPTALKPAEWAQWTARTAAGEPYPSFDGPKPVTHQVRVSINSAPFHQLWRGFWSVMRRSTAGGFEPYLEGPHSPISGDPFYGMRFGPTFAAIPNQVHPSLMFRPSIRDSQVPLDIRGGGSEDGPIVMILLRAALAAVNTEDLRDPDGDVTGRRIQLPGLQSGSTVRIYGTERQPFITEVYVSSDARPAGPGGARNASGYVAIELHNPYPEPIQLGPPTAAGGPHGWSVGLIDRRTSIARKKVVNLDGTVPSAATLPWRFPFGTVVPPGGFLVLENYDPDAALDGPDAALRALYRPGAAATGGALGAAGRPPEDSGCRTVYVPNLHRLLTNAGLSPATAGGGEFTLFRTRRADCTSIDNSRDPADPYNEQVNLHDLVPVDQFDFTGLRFNERTNGVATYRRAHYVRANDPDATPSGAWRFVYPGRYDGSRTTGRHQGMEQNSFLETAAVAPEAYASPVQLGIPDAACHPNQGSFPIQIGAVEDWPGPFRPRGAGPHRRPFGLFAREGDLLQVPFFGAYTIYAPSPPATNPLDVYEVQSLSMDSAFAEDSDTADDWPPRPGEQCEQIGRFCTVRVSMPGMTQVIHDTANDSNPPGGRTYQPGNPANGISQFRIFYRYRWARDLFDYFTVEAPHDDFLPNAAPSQYRLPSGIPAGPVPSAVANTGGAAGNSDPSDPLGAANDLAEITQPIEGRININTAPWKVLAALPLVVDPATGDVDVIRTEELAKAIVYFRDVHDGTMPGIGVGIPLPRRKFGSILDLNDVIDTRPPELRRPEFRAAGAVYGFRNGYGLFDPSGSGAEPGTPAGDLSPYRPGDPSATDHVRSDFEEQFLNVTRISNLITTHSDSFTCYVYVVGIQNVGSPQATARVERRVAFIVDRSTVTPERPVARIQRFSQD